MSVHAEPISGTYRCPVCGHRDVAEMDAGERCRTITCSYCDTPLEVFPRGADSVRFSVQVAEEPAPR
jgi:LSD1 subclass zinc finger protein